MTATRPRLGREETVMEDVSDFSARKLMERDIMKKIILDLDTGIDDTLALSYILGSEDAELIGITGTYGNVLLETGIRNDLNLLEMYGRPDIPVFKGVPHPSDADSFEVPDSSGIFRVFASLCGEGRDRCRCRVFPVCGYERGVLLLGLFPPRHKTENTEERLCPPYQPARSSACSTCPPTS